MVLRLLILVLAALAVVACDGPAELAKTPAAAQAVRPATDALPTFVDVAKEAGLTFVNHTARPEVKDWVISVVGGGAIVFDYDGDGRMDVLLIDGTMLTEMGEVQYDDAWRTRLYHNDGGMRFTDVTSRSGIDLKAFGIGGAACDFDGDGHTDFHVCCWGGNHLFRNRGDGTFEDVTEKAGLRGGGEMSTCCAWGDLDGDGWPDLYVANYIDQDATIAKVRASGKPSRSQLMKGGFLVYEGPFGQPGQKDRLWFNNGDGTFRDVTSTNIPPEDPPRYGFQPVMTDLDGDGDLDIYLANDTQANSLFVNDGHGKFTDVAERAGCAADFDHRYQASMGVDVADVNRDGALDMVVTSLALEHTTLYVHQGGEPSLSFVDRSNWYGVTEPSRLRVGWGVALFDYDNDGELDLFTACGHLYGEFEAFEQATGSTYREPSILQHNVGAPRRAFEDVSSRSGPALGLRRVWRAAIPADLDDDGDLDLLVTAINEPVGLFRNDGGNANAFLSFRLVGKPPLTDPSGARVTVWLADGKPRLAELHHGSSFASDVDPRLFFGLGRESSAKRVDVRWPNGQMQSFDDVLAGRHVLEQGGTLR